MSHILAAAGHGGTNTNFIAEETIFWILAVASVGAALAMIMLRRAVDSAPIGGAPPANADNGANNLSGLATLIFTTYVFPFEVTGALLITAALGAMVLAHRERSDPKPTQRDLAARRVASGQLAPDPSPGVYALHDAADRPALLPDGSTSELSVSETLSPRDPGEEPRFVRPEEAVPVTAETDERTAISGRADS